LDSTYGAAASIIVVLIWVYYSSQIILMDAEVTHAFSASPAVTMLNQPRSVPASTAVQTAAAKQHNENNNDKKRGDIHLRLPPNAAYCAAWMIAFLTTFSGLSGSKYVSFVHELDQADHLVSAVEQRVWDSKSFGSHHICKPAFCTRGNGN
jgi:hypothetical protein